MSRCGLFTILLIITICVNSMAQAPANGKLRIIAFGAHPDDCELKASGVAALWAAQGHKVKFVSMTNGDIGHFEEAGGPLAKRRTSEVEACAKALGIETQVLDIHDGELMPSLENRKTVARLIREWQADIVLCHRPYDYHPDHRYTGVLVEDASVVVAAAFFTPDTPPTKKNPVFLYYSDNFQRPYPLNRPLWCQSTRWPTRSGSACGPFRRSLPTRIRGRRARCRTYHRVINSVRITYYRSCRVVTRP
jgi:LmbE family N-acetylglucosaminyl deacetylase